MIKTLTPLIFAAAVLTVRGEHALHYKASAYDPSAGTWRAHKSETTLTAVYTNGGWVVAQHPAGSKIVYFDQTSGGTASPLQFPQNYTNTIRQIAALVLCEESAGFATLVSADCPVRFAAYPAHAFLNPPDPVETRELPEEFREHEAAIAVNIHDGNFMTPSPAKFQLLEFTFGNDTAANRVFIGGNAANPHWRRNWRGGIVEFITFKNELTPREANAVRRLFSAKHGLKLKTDPDDGIVGVLKSLGGVDDAGLFNTTIIVR